MKSLGSVGSVKTSRGDKQAYLGGLNREGLSQRVFTPNNEALTLVPEDETHRLVIALRDTLRLPPNVSRLEQNRSSVLPEHVQKGLLIPQRKERNEGMSKKSSEEDPGVVGGMA